jgi:hypothetical protein
MQKLIDTLRFNAARGEMYNPRTRKYLKMPMHCELHSVLQTRLRVKGAPCQKIARAEFKYRGRLYRVDFRSGRMGVCRLALDGIRRVVFYHRIVTSAKFNAVAYILLAMDEKKL